MGCLTLTGDQAEPAEHRRRDSRELHERRRAHQQQPPQLGVIQFVETAVGFALAPLLAPITRGPLFNADRWRAIWRWNGHWPELK